MTAFVSWLTRSRYCGLVRQREPGHELRSPPAVSAVHSPTTRCTCHAGAGASRQTCTLLKPR